MAQQPNNKKKQASKDANRSVATSTKRTAPTKAQRRSTSSLLTWGAIVLVLVVVIALVVIKIAGGSSTPGKGGGSSPAPASIVRDATKIPASVYDTVGITSPSVPVSKPTEIKGQPALTFADPAGGTKPGTIYIGAEYCPYCAAQRWSVVAALSRFGTFTNLGVTESSSTDVFPNTQTLSFYKATFSSPYLVFQGIEQSSNVSDPTSGYKKLQSLTKAQSALIAKYDTAKYLQGASPGSIPFLDVGNRFLSAGSSYSPSILSGLSRSDIASNLSDPTNPATQAIIATANYLTASICATTNQQPSSVCGSKGVKAAATDMGL